MTNLSVNSSTNNHKKLTQYTDSVILNIFEYIEEGIMITNVNKKIELVNPAFELVTGYRLEEIVGSSPAILNSGLHDTEFYRMMWNRIYEEGSWQGEIWNRRKTGEIYPEWLRITALKNEQGEVTNYCGIFTDLSERKHVENELEKHIANDKLTQIPNRQSFNQRMELLISSSLSMSHELQHAIFVMDLDRFKQLNDSLGHTIGDTILVEVANRIQGLVKNKDIVARYDGDEFVVTFTNIRGLKEAAKFAEHLISEFERPFQVGDQKIYVSISIGISMFPADGTSTEQLVNRAETAMSYSKANGRNSYSFYFDELNIDSKRVLLLDSEIRKAIKNREFELHLQPKINVQTKQIRGVEALVRWHNDKLGFVSPNEFIPYAEETGLIGHLSEIIFEKACEAHLQLVRAHHANVSIAINVSSNHFQQQNFIESVQRIFTHYNVSPKNFHMEVTERTVMNNATETIDKFERLKELGFQLSIDDFGTGYSSLSYLIRFPLDYLKIDRSFIQHICLLEDRQAVVDAIIQMSHRLHLKVVAEGVENIDQLKILEQLGCDYVQGFYLSKPLPIDELIHFLDSWEFEQKGLLNANI